MLITGVKTAPLRRGTHWETIGFQSEDPISDLRAAGMLGLLLPMQLFAKFEKLGGELARLSRQRDQEFPLMIVLIMFAAATLEAVGSSGLIRQSETDRACWDDMGRFFAGLVETLCKRWEHDGCDYAHDFRVFQEIANRGKARPLLAIRIGKKVEERESASTTHGLTQDNAGE
jgi:hypothetical protein